MKKIVLLITSSLFLLHSSYAQTITSAVPGLISYQGRALDTNGALIGSGAPVNRTVTFRVWDHPSNVLLANLIYSEQQVVTISGGEFSVLIGQGVATTGTAFGYSESTKGTPTVKIGDLPVFGATTRYLGVTIDDGSVAVDNEITPRQQIVSSAFAFRAKYAEQLGSNGMAALTALDSGNVGVGNIAPPALFTVSGANTSTSTSTPQLLVTADDITERLRIGVDSTGTGTGFIQSFKEGIGAQNLLLNPSGGNVGIGTTSPSVALSVTGAITATGAITGGSFTTAGAVTATGAVTGGSFSTSGGIGIGTKLTIGSLGGDTSTISPSFVTNAGALGTAAGNELILGNFGFSANSNSSLAISALRTAAGTNWFDTALILGMNVDFTKRAGGAFISLHGNGNVGIGTTIPTNRLSVEGGGQVASAASSTAVAHFGGGDVHTYFGSYDGASSYATWMQAMRPSDQFAFPMAINPNGGNVGIGTSNPSQKLDVNGNAYVRGQINLDGSIVMGDGPAIWGKNTVGGAEQTFWPRSSNGTYINYGTSGFYIRNNASTNTMTMTNGGIVSIGTGSNAARLNVGTASGTYATYGYLDSGGGQSGDTPSATYASTSIYADGRIVAPYVGITSDLRIKTDLHATDSVKDLETLIGIEVTDYKYKDKLALGNGPQKKVIAQQLEKVYPQAVNASKGVVPDIYKKAAVKDGWIKLATDLKKGDRVRLISNKEEAVHEVLEVKADRFLTQFKPVGDQVFVYGREVNDFRSVDYDAIAMLNVSATQELARQLKSVQAENAALRRELAAKDQTMEARLIAIEQRLTKKSAPETVSIKTAKAAK